MLFVLHGHEPSLEKLLQRLTVPHGTRLPADGSVTAVVRWGAHATDPDGPAVLNPLSAVLRCTYGKRLPGLLEPDGLRASGEGGGGTYVRRFRVPVFGLNALAVFEEERPTAWLAKGGPAAVRSEPNGRRGAAAFAPSAYGEWFGGNGRNAWYERPDAASGIGKTAGAGGKSTGGWTRFRELSTEEAKSSRHARLAGTIAVRAVYALGLDFAVVHIGITADARTVVRRVEPIPKLTERLAELFADAIAREADERRQDGDRQGEPMLGADPEFALRAWDGRIVPASRYFAREGTVGSDGVRVRGGRMLQALVELRPDPSADPLRLAYRLRRGLAAAARTPAAESDWLAGGMPATGLPLGGHIHFSNVRLDASLLRTLDSYLMLPLSMLEGPDSQRRRPRFGFLGDFRRQPHGGFEYRTPPSWLVSQETAEAVLCLAAVIAKHARSLRQRPLDRPDVRRTFYDGDKQRLLPFVRSVWEEIAGTEAFDRFRDRLESLKARIYRMEVWEETDDFKDRWKISPSYSKEGVEGRFML